MHCQHRIVQEERLAGEIARLTVSNAVLHDNILNFALKVQCCVLFEHSFVRDEMLIVVEVQKAIFAVEIEHFVKVTDRILVVPIERIESSPPASQKKGTRSQ